MDLVSQRRELSTHTLAHSHTRTSSLCVRHWPGRGVNALGKFPNFLRNLQQASCTRYSYRFATINSDDQLPCLDRRVSFDRTLRFERVVRIGDLGGTIAAHVPEVAAAKSLMVVYCSTLCFARIASSRFVPLGKVSKISPRFHLGSNVTPRKHESPERTSERGPTDRGRPCASIPTASPLPLCDRWGSPSPRQPDDQDDRTVLPLRFFWLVRPGRFVFHLGHALVVEVVQREAKANLRNAHDGLQQAGHG